MTKQNDTIVLVIKMEQNNFYSVKITSKEKFLEAINNQIDQIRFDQNIKNPTIELVFEDLNLNAKELYSLFDELVVHQGIVIEKILFTAQNEKQTEEEKKDFEITIIGDVEKEMVIVSPCNVHVVGKVYGTIILKHPADSIYSKEFVQCNAIIQGKAHYFDSCQNIHFKKQS